MQGSLQVKSGTYYAVFRVEHKQIWVSTHISTARGNKRKAEQELQRVLLEYADNKNNVNDMLFTDFLIMWIEQIKSTIKPVTWETYDKVIKGKIIPYFEKKHYKLKNLRGMHFTEYFVYLKEYGREDNNGGLSKKTILNIRGVLSSAFGYAVENEFIHDNVIEHSRLPIFEYKTFMPTVYNAEQMTTLLKYAMQTNSKTKLFLFLEMFTGCRKGELLALTWDNINFDDGTIYICQNRTGSKKEVLEHLTTPKTKNGYRTIPLPPKIIDMLIAEKALQERNKRILKECYKTYEYDYVIRQADGRIYNPNSINRIINKMSDKAGLPHCRVHDFRHAVASILFERGVPLQDVCTQLGHGQTSTTEKIYIHKSNIAKAENMRVLSGVINI